MSSIGGKVKNLPWGSIALPAVVMLLLAWGNRYSGNAEGAMHYAFQSAFWLVGAWLLTGVLEVFVWEGYTRHVHGDSVPKFFRHTASVLVFICALAGIFHVVFDQPLTGLWATSGVLGLVLGFALKSLISDFFSGVALSVNPPFRIGDWVYVRLGNGDPIYGRVSEMHWRLTKIQNRSKFLTVTIPHSLLAEASITTMYQAHSGHRFDVMIDIDQTVPVERAIRILETAVTGLPLVLSPPPPQVLVHDTNASGVQYRVRFWVSRDISMSLAKNQVLHALLDALRQAELGFANVKRDVYFARMNEQVWDPRFPKAMFISKVAVFSSFSQEEAEELAAKTSVRQIPAKHSIIRAGESGHSMFIVAEGLLEVIIDDGASGAVKVAYLRPGDFFGEMSLLTGDPRSATVTAASDAVLYEIGKEAIEPLLQRNRHIAEDMCRVVAARRERNLGILEDRMLGEAAEAGSGWASQLLGRVKSFFGLRF